MAFCVSYRFVRLTTVYEDLEGYVLINDYYGVEVNGTFLVKRDGDNTLYQAELSDVNDYSTDDNWFTIEGCRKLQTAKNIDNSWSQFVDQNFDQIHRQFK